MEDRKVPRGPQGQKRSADVVGCAVHVARIATGEIEEAASKPAKGQRGVGGKRRTDVLTPERRNEIAQGGSQGSLGRLGAAIMRGPINTIALCLVLVSTQSGVVQVTEGQSGTLEIEEVWQCDRIAGTGWGATLTAHIVLDGKRDMGLFKPDTLPGTATLYPR